MPYLQVTYPAGALDPTVRPRLAEDLTTTFMRWEGAPDNDFFRAACWVYFNEMPADAVNRGGAPASSRPTASRRPCPPGAMSARRKAGLVQDVTALLLDAEEDGDRDPMRVWVLITELPNGNWGAAGQIIDFEQLREAARRRARHRDRLVTLGPAPGTQP
jgi:phenylpyruvate tautomerase PptA (4-oxalocrotonate tautomerase family)